VRGLAEAQLQQVLEAVHEGVLLTADGRTTANAAARKILGVADDASVELRSALFDPRHLDGTPFPLEPSAALGQATIDNGVGGAFRIRARSLDGRELVIDGSSSPVDNGVVVVFRDVTEEYLQNQLNEQTLAALFDAIPVAIFVAEPETQEILTVNRAFCELIGREPDEIVGLRTPYPWWDEGESLPRELAPGVQFERICRRHDGRPQPVHVSIHGVGGTASEPRLVLALIEDHAEEQRMQQQLVQSGKLAAIGELAAGVAHEINNPLFAILGLTEFLLKETEPESKAHQRLELIQQTGLEIKEIVRALLDFARENADERHTVMLEDVVQSTCDLVRRTNAHKGVELIDTYDKSEALVVASPNQLKQIFLNLIANARQAMPNGGTVTVDVRREGAYAVATVADDGPGIDPSVAARIFEPFFTTKRLTGGTGLGLSVSLGIAEAHGGRLTVASEPGRGSAFTLSLPIADESSV
jgi:PAS domain S-box-containing protein